MRFVDMRKMNVADYMMSSNFLAANFRATYVQYIKIGKIMIKHEYMLFLLRELGRNVPAAKTPGMTYLDDLTLYILSKRHSFLII